MHEQTAGKHSRFCFPFHQIEIRDGSFLARGEGVGWKTPTNISCNFPIHSLIFVKILVPSDLSLPLQVHVNKVTVSSFSHDFECMKIYIVTLAVERYDEERDTA